MGLTAPSPSLAPKRKGIFPGYWMVLSGALQFGWAQGPVNLGIFMKPLQAAFGWTRAQISVAASLARLEGGIEAAPEGLAVDKWGPRAIQLIGVTMFSLALGAMYFVNSLWMLYLFWLLVATGHNVGYQGCLDKAVADWFVKRRALALNIMRAASSAVSPPVLVLVSWLLYTYGWREAFLVAGVATLVTGLPLTWFIIKPKRPEYYGWLPDGKRMGEELAADTEAAIKAGADYAAEAGEVEFTLRQALRNRIYWVYLAFSSFRSLAQPVIQLHLIPHLTDMGINPMLAAGVLGAMTFVQVPGRLIFGWLTDVVGIRRMKYLIMLGLVMESFAVFLLMRATSLVWVWAFVVIYGLGVAGGLAAGGGILRARFWGRKAFATISGVSTTVGSIVGIAAPIYAGWVYDTTGSYQTVFTLVVILLLIGAAVAFFLNPPKPPEKVGKITEFV